MPETIGIDDLIIGAWYADPNGNSQAGESYVVFGRDLSADPCPADLNGDGVLDFFDVFEFLGHYNLGTCTGPSGDYNGDGICNFFDVIAFLADYDNGNGCPYRLVGKAGQESKKLDMR